MFHQTKLLTSSSGSSKYVAPISFGPRTGQALTVSVDVPDAEDNKSTVEAVGTLAHGLGTAIAAVVASVVVAVPAFAFERHSGTPISVSFDRTEVLTGGGCAIAQHQTSEQPCAVDLVGVLRLLDAEAIEDGVSHPAEIQFGTLLEAYRPEVVAQAVIDRIRADGAHSAELVQLSGRSGGMTVEAKRSLITAALLSRRADVRDAAIQSVELWGDAALKPIVAAHNESVNWLREYLQAVIADLPD